MGAARQGTPGRPNPNQATVIMDTITIKDLEVHFRVGVPDEERANPQRLLITVSMVHPLQPAAVADDLARTINYFAVTEAIKNLGRDKSWKLIETLAEDIAALVLRDFKPTQVTVEVKKFIIPQTQYVSVRIERR